MGVGMRMGRKHTHTHTHARARARVPKANTFHLEEAGCAVMCFVGGASLVPLHGTTRAGELTCGRRRVPVGEGGGGSRAGGRDTRSHTPTDLYTHAHAYNHTHAPARASTHACTHTQIHARTHGHTRTQAGHEEQQPTKV